MIGGALGDVQSIFSVDGFFHEMARAMAHGVSQGGLSELAGGEFSSGFIAGFSGSAFGSAMVKVPGMGKAGDFSDGRWALRTTAAATVGGTGSELSGGDFTNGATTAAFVHLFNKESFTLEEAGIDFESGAGTEFESELEAASAAAVEVNQLTEQTGWEWAVKIGKKGDLWTYSEPVTSRMQRSVSYDAAILPDGFSFESALHSHPFNSENTRTGERPEVPANSVNGRRIFGNRSAASQQDLRSVMLRGHSHHWVTQPNGLLFKYAPGPVPQPGDWQDIFVSPMDYRIYHNNYTVYE